MAGGSGKPTYSAVKVPFLMIATFFLSLPSFFVLNTLFGLRDDFARVVRALDLHAGWPDCHPVRAGAVHGILVCLGQPYQPAILFNGMMFAVASFSAQWILAARLYAAHRTQSQTPLDAPDLDRHLCIRRHPDGLGAAAVHRRPSAPVQFFREGSWSNAYEFVFQMIWDELSGHARAVSESTPKTMITAALQRREASIPPDRHQPIFVASCSQSAVDLLLILMNVDLARPVFLLGDSSQLAGLCVSWSQHKEHVGVPEIIRKISQLDPMPLAHAQSAG